TGRLLLDDLHGDPRLELADADAGEGVGRETALEERVLPKDVRPAELEMHRHCETLTILPRGLARVCVERQTEAPADEHVRRHGVVEREHQADVAERTAAGDLVGASL